MRSGDMLRVARIAPNQQVLETPEERAMRPGVHDLPDSIFYININLDLQMPFNPGDGIDDGGKDHGKTPALRN